MTTISKKEKADFEKLVRVTKKLSAQDPEETYFLFTPIASNNKPPYVSNDEKTSHDYGSYIVDKFRNGFEQKVNFFGSPGMDMD